MSTKGSSRTNARAFQVMDDDMTKHELEVHIKEVVRSANMDNIEALTTFARRIAVERDDLKRQVSLPPGETICQSSEPRHSRNPPLHLAASSPGSLRASHSPVAVCATFIRPFPPVSTLESEAGAPK
jgi:hypothetical protein